MVWDQQGRRSGPESGPVRGSRREFLDAVVRYDADAAVSYLITEAVVQGNAFAYTGSDDAENLRLTIAHFRAAGYKQTINDCAQLGDSASGVIVSCTFDLQAIRSDEIGVGPFTDNVWRLTVRDGKIVSAQQEMPLSSNGFYTQVWAPFAAWVSIEHSDDVLTMYINE